MPSCFSLVKLTPQFFGSFGCYYGFLLPVLFMQSAFAQSLNSFEEIEVLEVILAADQLSAQNIKQFSIYDHVAQEYSNHRLSDIEAQALLEHNSQSLSYSVLGGIYGQEPFEFVGFVCGAGAVTGVIVGSLTMISKVIKKSNWYNWHWLLYNTTFGGLYGCVAVATIGMIGGYLVLTAEMIKLISNL